MNGTLRILAFGKLSDLMPAGLEIDWQQANLYTLKCRLEKEYPSLAGRTYRIAVNRKMAGDDAVVAPGDEIALLPPFSGG